MVAGAGLCLLNASYFARAHASSQVNSASILELIGGRSIWEHSRAEVADRDLLMVLNATAETSATEVAAGLRVGGFASVMVSQSAVQASENVETSKKSAF